jgi:aerobic carbon-monoxide dehydrogenase medium subunit
VWFDRIPAGSVKAPPFDYAAPSSVEEAVALLEQRGDDASVLAGGQSLVPLLALRLAHPELIVDINRVGGLSDIERQNGHVRVGALVRHAALIGAVEAAAVPLLGRAAPLIGHFQIRNRGTLCGSLTHADAAAEWPLVAVTLDAVVELRSATRSRTVPARDFFAGPFMTARRADELVVAVRFPVWAPHAGFAIEEFTRRSGDFAIAGAACGIEIADGRITRCAIGLLGLAGVPLRADAAEQALIGTSVEDVDPVAVGQLAVADLRPPADVHASGRYRLRIGAATVSTAVTRALEEAGRG